MADSLDIVASGVEDKGTVVIDIANTGCIVIFRSGGHHYSIIKVSTFAR